MPSYAERGQFDAPGATARLSAMERRHDHLMFTSGIQVNPAGAVEEIAYEFTLKDPEWQTNAPAIVNGHALRDASVNDAEGPYPPAIFPMALTQMRPGTAPCSNNTPLKDSLFWHQNMSSRI